MKEIKDLLDEVMKDDYLKSKIKQAFSDKIIETIKYNTDDMINECVKSIFDEKFKIIVHEKLKEQKDNLQKLILETVKTQIDKIKDRIEIKLSRWDLNKIFNDSIKFKD